MRQFSSFRSFVSVSLVTHLLDMSGLAVSQSAKVGAFNGMICAALLGFILAASGCQAPSISTPVTATQTSSRSRSAAIDVAAKGNIRTGATYKQAVAAYGSHHYADASHLLTTLLATPDLSAEDKTFLLRQKQLCQAASSGTSAVDALKVVSAPIRAKRPSSDCGPRALLLLCQAQHVSADLSTLSKAAHTNKDGTSMNGLASAAQSVGFHAEGVQMDKNALTTLSRPAIAWVDGNHYVAVLNVHANPWTGKTSVTIHDPNKPEQEELSPATLLSRSGGVLLVLSSAKAKKAS